HSLSPLPISTHSVYIHKPDCNSNCNCDVLEQVEQFKHLGVIIDKKLSWKLHVNYLLQKVRFSVLVIYKIKNIARVRLMKLLYCSFFQPYLQYCLVAYRCTYDNVIKPLLTLQTKNV